MRVALGLEYHGASFCGWQSQRNGQGIQDVLSHALSRVANSKVWPIAAGRTDAGVHASMQVVHFDTEVRRPVSAWVRGTNIFLSDAVAVLWAKEVPQDFHARFCAKARTYRYVLLNRQARPALHAHDVGWFHWPLSLEAMQKGCAYFCGTHDFSSFRTAECQAKSPVRAVFYFDISKKDDMFFFTVKANAFLHRMVRNMLAALIMVGTGKKPAEWIVELLQAKNRAFSLPTVSPFGLYLTAIDYDSCWSLPITSTPAIHDPH
jgi:tRNA pseudouridine38-40 synthase